MIEVGPQNEMSLLSWVTCFVPESQQAQALELCRQQGYRPEAVLPENSWRCLETWLYEKLGI